MANTPVVVFGAGGHTGRFVVAELARRGRPWIAAGRDAAKLAAVRAAFPSAEIRTAAVTDAAALDRVLAGCSAVINCAGPFLDTALPLAAAALRARAHYLDVAAEQATTLAVLERFAAPARDAEVVVLPAMAFYGGVADLLATAVMADWPRADALSIAVALDRWHPTAGTRVTGQRNTARRLVVSRGQLSPLPDPAPHRTWTFPAPFGPLEVAAVPLSEIITISRHLRADSVDSYMNLAPLADLRDASTPPPAAADASGRSAQTFVLEVVARTGGAERRAHVRGRDIYAITAPIVVEALDRILDGRIARTGAAAPGELFDAGDFLRRLPLDELRQGSPGAGPFPG